MDGGEAFSPYVELPSNGEPLTPSSAKQLEVEFSCAPLLSAPAPLARDAHVAYLLRSLDATLSPRWAGSHDALRVWMTFWCFQGLDVLDAARGAGMAPLHARAVALLAAAQVPPGPRGGGFGGGPQQEAHAASTYAAVSALVIIGTPEALAVPHRAALAAFFARLRGGPGGGPGARGARGAGALRVTEDGEGDTRGAYTVLAAATLLNLATPPLLEGVAGFLARCQSQEGGFGGEPGNEAHGGYTYCALAALALAGVRGEAGFAAAGVDYGALARWLRARQMRAEGGFSGRCNKLVDGCYSFWLGAACRLAPGGGFSEEPAANYVLRCAQAPGGGCRDKPGMEPDHYHTCYVLCGLSVAGGGGQPGVHALDPVFNLRPERVAAARAHFGALPAP
jgi:protein farnesyltransferase subunit beta